MSEGAEPPGRDVAHDSPPQAYPGTALALDRVDHVDDDDMDDYDEEDMTGEPGFYDAA